MILEGAKSDFPRRGKKIPILKKKDIYLISHFHHIEDVCREEDDNCPKLNYVVEEGTYIGTFVCSITIVTTIGRARSSKLTG